MKKIIRLTNNGITLVALIITIIIMLILATVTIGAINGGLFDYARHAKISAEDASIMEGIQKAFILAKGESNTNIVTENDFQKQVDKALPDENATVAKEGNGFVVLIGEKYYVVTENGIVNAPQAFEKVEYAGDITKGGTCTGTQSNPYRIECIEDLVKLSEIGNNNGTNTSPTKFFLLAKDLDFNSIFSYGNYKAKYSYDSEKKAYVPDENSETTIMELCTTGEGFIPISLSYGADGSPAFHGTFYGVEQRTIKNIYINRSGVAALFGACSGNATIKNIILEGNITSTGNIAVGFVGVGWSCTIQDCINKAKITSKTSYASGIKGGGGKGTLTNCINEGEIIAENGKASGIAHFFVTINKCKNLGTVKGKTGASGITIERYGGDIGTMKNSCNLGTVICTGTGSAGGLTLANNTYNKIYNSYSVGVIKQEQQSSPVISRDLWSKLNRRILV